jgi:hypothetical protein
MQPKAKIIRFLMKRLLISYVLLVLQTSTLQLKQKIRLIDPQEIAQINKKVLGLACAFFPQLQSPRLNIFKHSN